MQISRFGNQHCDLIDEMIEKASKKEQDKEQPGFEAIVAKVLGQPKQLSLREIFKTAQFDDALPLGDAGGELPEPEGPPGPSEGAGDEDVKQHLVEALIALCGDAETAKSCIDEFGGVPEELPGEGPEGIGEPAPVMDEMNEMPAPMEMNEMPAPMEMM